MAEYIELEAAIALIREQGVYGEGHSDEERENNVISMLESIPTADVAQVVHARWNDDGRCTNCGCHAPFWCMASTYHESPFCFECGARMDGE